MKICNIPTCVAALALALAACVASSGVAEGFEGMDEAAQLQRVQLERMSSFLGPPEANEVEPAPLVKRESLISFANPRAREFFVDGTRIPDGKIACARVETHLREN